MFLQTNYWCKRCGRPVKVDIVSERSVYIEPCQYCIEEATNKGYIRGAKSGTEYPWNS